MTDQRFILEMGMGNDLFGMDYTKAAARAIEDALRHSALPMFQATDTSTEDMRVEVTVGVQAPDRVDRTALAQMLPHGRVTVTAVQGGLNVTDPKTGNTIVIAAASIEAFLPPQAG
ncbi:MAG: Lin0512 family protein [Pseudomonadota bacterium]